jgi:hypothetical protein
MAEPRCYTKRDVLRLLQLTNGSYKRLLAAGKLPMLEELKPRIGVSPRFRADLVDRYLAGQWGVTAFGRRRAG